MEHKLIIPARIYTKLFRYANAVHSEISGWGKIESSRETHRLTKIILLEQVCSMSSTTLNSEKLTQMYINISKKGEDPASYNLWWHSHYDFGVFWSQTDESAIKGVVNSNKLFSICINKNGEIIGRIDIKREKPIIPLIVIEPINDIRINESIIKNVKRKVKRNYMRLIPTLMEGYIDNLLIKGEVNEKVKQENLFLTSNRFFGYY